MPSPPDRTKLVGPISLSQSVFEGSILPTDDHERPLPDIMLRARGVAAIRPSPIQFKYLDPPAPLPVPSIEEDLHPRIAGKFSCQHVAKLSLIPGHDDQRMDLPGRRGFIARRLPEATHGTTGEFNHLPLVSAIFVMAPTFSDYPPPHSIRRAGYDPTFGPHASGQMPCLLGGQEACLPAKKFRI